MTPTYDADDPGPWGGDAPPARDTHLAAARKAIDDAMKPLSSATVSDDDRAKAARILGESIESLAWLSVLVPTEWKAALFVIAGAPRFARQGKELERAVKEARALVHVPRIATDDDIPPPRESDWPEPDEDVDAALSRTEKGKRKPTYANLITVLRKDPRWNSLRMNGLGSSIEWNGKAIDEGPAIATVAQWVAGVYPGLDYSPVTLTTAVVAVAAERRYIPMQEYLLALKWDGVQRLIHIPSTFLGVPTDHEEFELYGIYTKRFLISAVARAMCPGSKVDTALIFVGKQGAKKSTFFEVMFGEWYADSPIKVGDKDAFINLSAAWGYEASELESLTSRTVEAVKQFMSGRRDTYRPPFGRIAVKVPRHSVLCGSTNKPEILSDDTGARRFWPMTVPDSWVVPVKALRAVRDQLWAEALYYYKMAAPYGEDAPADCRWWFDRGEEEDRADDLEDYRVHHAWEDPIRKWLDDTTSRKDQTKLHEVYVGALGGQLSHIDAKVERDIAKCLRALGWSSKTERDEDRKTRRCWCRPVKPA